MKRLWALVAIGLIASIYFLAHFASIPPLFTLLFCLSMLIASVWYGKNGIVAVFSLTLVGEFIIATGPFPWLTLWAELGVAINAFLVTLLLEPKIVEKFIEVRVPDLQRVQLLNEARSALWEKELQINYLTQEIVDKEKALRAQEDLTRELEEARSLIENHPAKIAYRELRKQFVEKSDVLHHLRQKMFDLESDLLTLQRQREEEEAEKVEAVANLMRLLGKAEEEESFREEHIMLLEKELKPPVAKRTSRKKTAAHPELFNLQKPKRKRASSASIYYAS